MCKLFFAALQIVVDSDFRLGLSSPHSQTRQREIKMWINRHDIATEFDTHKAAVDYQATLNHENGWQSRVESHHSTERFYVRYYPKYVMPRFVSDRESSGPYTGTLCDEAVGF